MRSSYVVLYQYDMFHSGSASVEERVEAVVTVGQPVPPDERVEVLRLSRDLRRRPSLLEQQWLQVDLDADLVVGLLDQAARTSRAYCSSDA